MKILLLDNYDSFTYNLLHAVKELGATDVEVVRNDQINLDEVERFDKIILSPGPGIPEEAGLLLPIIKRYAPTKSILGVCLGHQAIGEAFGARLENLKEVYHGVQTPISILQKDVRLTIADLWLTIADQPLFQKASIIHRAKANAQTVPFHRHFLKSPFSSKGTCFHFGNISHRKQHSPKNILFESP